MNPKFDLSGRTAAVTGGGLLGAQFALALAESGADVCVLDVNSKTAEDAASAIMMKGLSCTWRELDVTDESQVADYFASIGELDVLVNSAAIDPKVSRLDQGDLKTMLADFKAAIDVSLVGTYLMSSYLINKVGPNRVASIINLTSTYGLVGPDQRIYGCEEPLTIFKPAHYSAAKAGVVGLTKYFSAACRGTKIRVNALAPGGVQHQQSEEFRDRYSSRAILGRMARSDEMNGAIVFMASDASSYMTGSVVVVDGGWTAW